MSKTLPNRAEVDARFTWNSESVFPDGTGWEAAVSSVLAKLPDLAEFEGHLGESPDMLADWFDAADSAHLLMGKVIVYATMSYSVDATDQAAAARADRARTTDAQLSAAMAFAVPEMIAQRERPPEQHGEFGLHYAHRHPGRARGAGFR